MRRNYGFTLIELVVVIVILGVLSAFALPRFVDLQDDARRAKVEGAAGAMRTAARVVFSACQVRDGCDVSEGPAGGNGQGNSIELEGKSIVLAYGYPRDSQKTGIARAASIRDLADGGDYDLATFTNGLRVRPDADTGVNVCEVRYTQPADAGEGPDVEVDTGGC